MTGFRVHFTHHAVREMRKISMTRQMAKQVIRLGRRDTERYRTGEIGWVSTLRIGTTTFAVVWVKRRAHLLVITAYIVGEYD